MLYPAVLSGFFLIGVFFLAILKYPKRTIDLGAVDNAVIAVN